MKRFLWLLFTLSLLGLALAEKSHPPGKRVDTAIIPMTVCQLTSH